VEKEEADFRASRQISVDADLEEREAAFPPGVVWSLWIGETVFMIKAQMAGFLLAWETYER
jgi:hypothetical protein